MIRKIWEVVRRLIKVLVIGCVILLAMLVLALYLTEPQNTTVAERNAIIADAKAKGEAEHPLIFIKHLIDQAKLQHEMDAAGEPYKKGTSTDEDGIADDTVRDLTHEVDQRMKIAKMVAIANVVASNKPDEESLVRQRHIWENIESHMVDPQLGAYPVKFYGPENGVPLLKDDENGYYGASTPIWIDNQHVIYWGGVGSIVRQEGQESKSFFDHRELMVVDVDTGKVIKIFLKNEKPGGFCFNVKTRKFSYSLPDERYKNSTDRDEKYRRITYFGVMNENMEFEKQFNTLEKPNLYSNSISCGEYEDLKISRNPIAPEDGKIIPKTKSTSHGQEGDDFVFIHPDGRQKNSLLDCQPGCSFYGLKYDYIRDLYYISKEDRDEARFDIFYFDHDLDLVEKFFLPHVSSGYGADPLLMKPAKDGFVVGCNRNYDVAGKLQIYEEPMWQYLCHIKRDQTIVRAVKGAVSDFSVSPDGCRVFGYWKERWNDRSDTGKNFMVDMCSMGKPVQEK